MFTYFFTNTLNRLRKAVVFLSIFVFFGNNSFAQFTGGVGAGASLFVLEVSACSATGTNPFTGGSSDGFSIAELTLGACAGGGLNPFLCGDSDGFSFSNFENTSCAISGINPFIGGDSDGFSMFEFENTACDITGINPFLGGISDGFTQGDFSNTLCTVIGINPYWGGISDGFSYSDISISYCGAPSVSAYSGGIGDGHFATPNVSYAVWQGDDLSFPTDWHVAENWNVNLVPHALLNVTIPASTNNPIIAASAETACLNINTLGDLTINPNGDLTVNGNFQNEGILNLNSPSNSGAAGSLIVEGVISGTGTANIDRYYNVSSRWQYTTVPFSNVTSSLFANYGTNFNPNFYSYSEPFDLTPDPTGAIYANWQQLSAAWLYAHNGSAGAHVGLDKGTGYIYYYTANRTVSYSNTINDLENSDLVFPVTYTPNDANSDYFDGWNLLGNPYPSAIDWDAFAKTNIHNTVYYWDGDNKRYVYYNGATGTEVGDGSNYVNGGSRYIPSLQAFFVKATADGNFTIPRTARTHSTQVLWKSAQKSDNIIEYLKLTASIAGGSDELCVRFVPESTPEFDAEFDAYKIFAYENPNLFSLTQEIPTALNSLPELSADLVVPVGFSSATSGNASINLSENNLAQNRKIFLRDLQTQTVTDLTESAYAFSASGNQTRQFELFFIETGSDSEYTENQSDIHIFSHQKTIYVSTETPEKYQRISVTNTLGQVLLSADLTGTQTEITTDFAAGVYFVSLSGNFKTVSKKVVLSSE